MPLTKCMIAYVFLVSCFIFSMDHADIFHVKTQPAGSQDVHLNIFNSDLKPQESSSAIKPQGSLMTDLKNSRNEKKIIPQDAEEMRNLVKTYSVNTTKQKISKRPVSVPPFNDEMMERVRDSNPYLERQSKDRQRMYTHEDVIDLLRAAGATHEPQVTSRLYEIGRNKNVPLERLQQHAKLFDEIHVSPRVLAEVVYQCIGEYDKKPENFEVRKYEKTLQRDPNKYEELVFSAFEAILDEASGKDSSRMVPHELVDTHAGFLKQEIAQQGDYLFKAKIAIVVKFLVLCGTAAWAIYAQVSSNCPAAANAINGTSV